MNCPDFERLIALDVEGDLPEPQGRAVAEHLRACPSCRQFSESLKISQALLKELGEEPVDEPMVQEVRRRVRNGLASATPRQVFPVWRLAWGAGLIAALVLAVLILRHHSREEATQEVAEKSAPASAPLHSAASKIENGDSRIGARSAKSVPAARHSSINPPGGMRATSILPAPSVAGRLKSPHAGPPDEFSSGSLRASADAQHLQPLTVKLITDNPNVVIYWLVD
ncbi:MAG: zf-HC2 domain-containing protein [Terriglobia bacterium]|jgi:hypothetical protein